MKKYKLFIIISILSLGCADKTSTTKTEEKPIMVRDSVKVKSLAKSILYEYENDTIIQQLQVLSMSDNKLEFVLTIKNTRLNSVSSISGVAHGNPGQDVEIEEDEEGNAYPTIQYTFNKDCELYFKISQEDKKRVRIVEGDCNIKHDLTCPFYSINTLVRR